MNEIPKSQPLSGIAIERIIRVAVRKSQNQPSGALHLLAKSKGHEPCQVVFTAGLPIAAWKPQSVDGKRQHLIGISRDFYRHAQPRTRLNERTLEAFCRALIRHEVAHAIFTDPVAEACKAARVPHLLLNLFEDARVEHLERERARPTVPHGGWRFHWWCFLNIEQQTEDPTRYFWALMRKEASSRERYSAGAPRWLGKPGTDVRIRDYYYDRAIKARKTEDLISLGQEWQREFSAPSSSFGNQTPSRERA